MIFEVKVIYEAPDELSAKNVSQWIDATFRKALTQLGPNAIAKPLVGLPVRLDIPGR